MGAGCARLGARTAARGEFGSPCVRASQCCDRVAGSRRGGSYEQLESFNYVGEGKGKFNKETVKTGGRCKPKCGCIVFMALLCVAVYCYAVHQGQAPAIPYFDSVFSCIHEAIELQLIPSYDEAISCVQRFPLANASNSTTTSQRTHNSVLINITTSAAPAAPVPVLSADTAFVGKPRFLCSVLSDARSDRVLPGSAPDGPAALVAAAILEATWRMLDDDGNDRVDLEDLMTFAQKRYISPRVHRLLSDAVMQPDGDQQSLTRQKYVSVVVKAGLLSHTAPPGGWDAVTSAAITEAAWLVADADDDDLVELKELKTTLLPARLLTSHTLQLLLGSDASGSLDNSAFMDRLAKAGMTSGFIVQDLIGVAVGEVVWNAADVDSDDRICRNELDMIQKKDVPTRVKQLYIKADECLSQEKFLAAVTQNGGSSELAAALTKYIETPSITSVYAADAARAAPVESWPRSKKVWCCENVGLGCPTSTTPRHVPAVVIPATTSPGMTLPTRRPAAAIPAVLVSGSTDAPPTSAEIVATTTGSTDASSTSATTAGVPLHTTLSSSRAPPLPFDCAEGATQTWPHEKRSWCCEKTGFGCKTATTTTTPPFDCDSRWVNGWSEGKRDYCCENANVGCTTTTTLPYDCKADYTKWDTKWSNEKQGWCCYHYGRGCPTTAVERPTLEHGAAEPTTTTLPYDCDAGYSNWEDAWTGAKKVWCCTNDDRGCLDSTPDWVKSSVQSMDDH